MIQILLLKPFRLTHFGFLHPIGCDQGFHSYLYYSSKLHQATTIQHVVVWEEGRGIFNNVGATQTKPRVEWRYAQRDE